MSSTSLLHSCYLNLGYKGQLEHAKVLPVWLGSIQVTGGILRGGWVDSPGRGCKGTIVPVDSSVLVLPMADWMVETIDLDGVG